MNVVLSVIYAIPFFIYDIIVSSLLRFVPRSLRKKKDITGKAVLITGAGSGVGRELAIEFSKHSVRLILVDINRQSLLQTEKLLNRQSPVFIYDCDVSDHKKVYEMAKKVKMDVGDVEILVNNAGIVSGDYLLDLPEEKIIKTFEVNAISHFWTCKAFLPAMMERNEGHIVSIASVAGKSGGSRVTDYCASKFAAVGFAESLALELIDKKFDGIKVTTVCPSLINTGLFAGAKMPVGGSFTPEYVAEEVVAGVLEDEDIIYIPRYFKYLTVLKELSPQWLNIKVFKMTGLIHAMDNFTGRIQNGNTVIKN